MQHKNNINSSLLAITEHCKYLPDSLKQETDFELVKLAQSCSAQSASAKTLLISRYLPKVIRESKKIFNGQTRNFWDMEDIIQTGIKGILYAIKSFDKKVSDGFATVACLNISKYLNKKKTNYDPVLKFDKGPEFKRVFYNYFKALKELKKQKKGINQLETKDILTKLNCSLDTLKAVQYAHGTLGNLILSSESATTSSNAGESNDEGVWNLIDYATVHETIGSTVELPKDPAVELEAKQGETRSIIGYKNLLTNKEWLLLSLLNSGIKKEKILDQLNVSKQRFSFLTKTITKKIQNKNEGVFTN